MIAGHAFVGVAGHPDDDECTHRADGTDASYCGAPAAEHAFRPVAGHAAGTRIAVERYTEIPFGPTVHELKTDPDPFFDVLTGLKTFEVRRDDRRFRVGEVLRLREFYRPYVNPDGTRGAYTGRDCYRRITYRLDGGEYGIEAGYVVLGIGPL